MTKSVCHECGMVSESEFITVHKSNCSRSARTPFDASIEASRAKFAAWGVKSTLLPDTAELDVVVDGPKVDPRRRVIHQHALSARPREMAHPFMHCELPEGMPCQDCDPEAFWKLVGDAPAATYVGLDWRRGTRGAEVYLTDDGRFVAAIIRHRNDERAMKLADKAGALKTENDELLRENARLRRDVERLERKAKVGR